MTSKVRAIPEGKSLRPFQKEAVRQMLKFGNCLNACEQGLGKSVQAIVYCNAKQAEKILVVCPAVVTLNWLNEFHRWNTLPTARAYSIQGSDFDALSVQRANFVTVSYSMVLNDDVLKALKAEAWDVMIFDEAHYLKNYKAQRTKVCLKELWPCGKNHIFLTGTPFLQGIKDGFTLFNRLAPDLFPKYWDFCLEFTNVIRKRLGRKEVLVPEGLKNSEKLKQLISDRFYLRYRKEDVLSDLPDKEWTEVRVPKEYRAAAEKAVVIDDQLREILEGLGTVADTVPKHLMELRKDQGLAKVPFIAEYCKELLDQGIPLVIFAHHRDVIGGLLKELGAYQGRIITGDVPNKDRQTAVELFQGGELDFLICNYVAGGTGITLTRSQNCIVAEPDWIPATIAQAVDRLHRIGQQGTVQVHYFLVEGSLDMEINRTLMRRARDFNKVLKNES